MKYLEKLEQLEFFNLPTLKELVDLQSRSLYKLVKRRVRDNTFLQLKKGLYTTSSFVNQNKDLVYKEKVANRLKMPSYLSMEYMLNKYSILSESVFSFTSISTKKTNTYVNKLGTYQYRSIKKDLFKGYFLENDVYYATKAKALFDYLYFKRKDTNIESLRLNLNEINNKDLEEFKYYCTNDAQMMAMYNNLLNYIQNVS